MRVNYFPTLVFGLALVYLSAFGLGGLGLNKLNQFSLSDVSGVHNFVDAYEQGGPYTDIKASISTSRIVDLPNIPMSMNGFLAAAWIACEQRAGNSNPTWFMQIGWYSIAQNLAGTPTATYYDTVFWATSPTYEINDVASVLPGEVHNYEIKQETDGWHLIFDKGLDDAFEKVLTWFSGSCNMLDVCEELTSPQPSQWNPAAINCGQIVFSNLEATSSGTQFSYLSPPSNSVLRLMIDPGSNGLSYQSATQLTVGWGLSTSPGNPSYGSSSGSSSSSSGSSSSSSGSSSSSDGSSSSSPSSSSSTPSTPSFNFNIDWNAIWNDVNTMVDANQELIMTVGGLMALVSFIGFIMPPKKIGVSW